MTGLPSFVQIEPVGQCNLRCRRCPMQSLGMTELDLQGLGEPLLHLRFFDMARPATQRGVPVSAHTHLTVMCKAGAHACMTSGLHRLPAAVGGATAQIYQPIHVRLRFERALCTLRRIARVRLKLLQSRLPYLRLVAVVSRKNLAELPDMVRRAHEEGRESAFVPHMEQPGIHGLS